MTFVYKKGDVLEATENIICQSVNHKGVMGAGLALQVKNRYPLAFNMYRELCNSTSFEFIRLHGVTSMYQTQENEHRWIVSIFGQMDYGTDQRHTDYVSLITGFESVLAMAKKRNYSVAIPYGIGCGLGGGDWNIVGELIKDVFRYNKEIQVAVYEL